MGTEGQQVFAVTGATGFLGAHLLRRLLGDGHSVRMLVRARHADAVLLDGLDEEQRARCAVVVGDINDGRRVRELLRVPGAGGAEPAAVDGVFHLAGVVRHTRRRAMVEETMRVNVDGAMQVVRSSAEAGVPRCVVASTSGTVAVRRAGAPGGAAGPARGYAEEATRRWPYYVSKIEMEKRIQEFVRAAPAGPAVVFVRPSLLLGPGDVNLSSCGTVDELVREALPLVPSGSLNFVDVRDAADATAAAMYRGAPGGAYLLGAANMATADFFAEVAGRAGVRAPSLRLPTWLTVALAALADAALRALRMWRPALDPVLAEMGAADWRFDEAAERFDEAAASAADDLGFSPRAWGETIDDTIAWLRRRGGG